MKVILRADLPGVGRHGEIIQVKPGYARNYLIPHQLAMPANDQNMKIWEKEKVKIGKQREQEIGKARELAERIEKTSLTIAVKVGEGGKMFGSVTSADVAGALVESGFSVEKHDVSIEEPIKEVGVYTVKVKVFEEVYAKAKVWIVEEKPKE